MVCCRENSREIIVGAPSAIIVGVGVELLGDGGDSRSRLRRDRPGIRRIVGVGGSPSLSLSLRNIGIGVGGAVNIVQVTARRGCRRALPDRGW